MNDARIKVELSIDLHYGDEPADFIDQICGHLRSGLSSCQDFEVVSLKVSDEVLDLQLGEILLIAWVDIRSSDNAEGARKRVLNHIFAHFEDDPSVSYESISLRVEVIPRRREAIEATKAKQAKKDSNASD